jgi:hypothetical protein
LFIAVIVRPSSSVKLMDLARKYRCNGRGKAKRTSPNLYREGRPNIGKGRNTWVVTLEALLTKQKSDNVLGIPKEEERAVV